VRLPGKRKAWGCVVQDNGLVPIVEPEILMDGPHIINTCAAATERVIAACYKVGAWRPTQTLNPKPDHAAVILCTGVNCHSRSAPQHLCTRIR